MCSHAILLLFHKYHFVGWLICWEGSLPSCIFFGILISRMKLMSKPSLFLSKKCFYCKTFSFSSTTFPFCVCVTPLSLKDLIPFGVPKNVETSLGFGARGILLMDQWGAIKGPTHVPFCSGSVMVRPVRADLNFCMCMLHYIKKFNVILSIKQNKK